MLHILFYFIGIYSHPLALFNLLRLGAVGCNSIDIKPIHRRLFFYGTIAFVFDMWILGRLIHF
jgi:hypothetical protein